MKSLHIYFILLSSVLVNFTTLMLFIANFEFIENEPLISLIDELFLSGLICIKILVVEFVNAYLSGFEPGVKIKRRVMLIMGLITLFYFQIIYFFINILLVEYENISYIYNVILISLSFYHDFLIKRGV